MKYEVALVALACVASARDVSVYSARLSRREVPQEHSHEAIIRATTAALQLNNPLNIVDSVFGLLGNAAAAEGAPEVDNLDCLQQIIADQAFTNAKEAVDLDGQINAILYRALERNTLTVGEASPLCNETAVNPEIANIQQHQDPASPEAVNNAAVELEVAKSLASIGADPCSLSRAPPSPGEIGDPTAAGNTCNDETDEVGCIFTLGLLTPAVTEEEILAAVEGIGADVGDSEDDACEVPEVEQPATNSTTGSDSSGETATGTTNVQAFTGTLGGPPPPVISNAGSDRPFEVNGATFQNAAAALQRSCAVQKNACANAANAGQLEGGTQQCDAQEAECRAANNLRRLRRAARLRRQVGAALDFGSCGSPAIQFAAGLDGRREESFQNVNTADFNHGSAQNIAIIADFTCDRLQSSCRAPEETVQACQAAAQAAAQAAQAANGQAAADAFNSVLGVSA